MSEKPKKCVYQSRVFDVNLYNFSKILLNNSRFHIDIGNLFKWEQYFKHCSHKIWLLFPTSTQRGTKNLVKTWPLFDPTLTPEICSPFVPIFTKSRNKPHLQWEQYQLKKVNLRSNKKEWKQLPLFSLFDIYKQAFFSIAYSTPLNHVRVM